MRRGVCCGGAGRQSVRVVVFQLVLVCDWTSDTCHDRPGVGVWSKYQTRVHECCYVTIPVPFGQAQCSKLVMIKVSSYKCTRGGQTTEPARFLAAMSGQKRPVIRPPGGGGGGGGGSGTGGAGAPVGGGGGEGATGGVRGGAGAGAPAARPVPRPMPGASQARPSGAGPGSAGAAWAGSQAAGAGAGGIVGVPGASSVRPVPARPMSARPMPGAAARPPAVSVHQEGGAARPAAAPGGGGSGGSLLGRIATASLCHLTVLYRKVSFGGRALNKAQARGRAHPPGPFSLLHPQPSRTRRRLQLLRRAVRLRTHCRPPSSLVLSCDHRGAHPTPLIGHLNKHTKRMLRRSVLST